MNKLYEVRDSLYGRSLFTLAPIAAGTNLIVEKPRISWALKTYRHQTCNFCMKFNPECIDGLRTKCVTCSAAYCSEECRLAHLERHQWICKSSNYLEEKYESLDIDGHSLVQCILEVFALWLSGSNDSYRAFMSQSSNGIVLSEEEEKACAIALEVVLSTISPDLLLSVQAASSPESEDRTLKSATFTSSEFFSELFRDIICKDKSCGFAIMLPKGQRAEDDMIRGFSSCPELGLCNHSCMPNCTRWDNADGGAVEDDPLGFGEELTLTYRTLFDLEAGTELRVNYMPISWSFKERQAFSEDVFGFVCACPRCAIERNDPEQNYDSDDGEDDTEWEDCDDDEDVDDGDEATKDDSTWLESDLEVRDMEIKEDEVNLPEVEGINNAYIGLFLLRHCCNIVNGGGSNRSNSIVKKSGGGGDDDEKTISLKSSDEGDDSGQLCTGVLTPCYRFDACKPGMDTYQCSVCLVQRSHAEFLQILSEL